MIGGPKKNKWGPVVLERSTRIRNDGRTSLEKAKENKKKEDLEGIHIKGKKSKAGKLDNLKHLLNVAKVVGVDLGENEIEIRNNLKACSDFGC
jgi:hypothetical protein